MNSIIQSGLVVVDKPAGMTSHDVVARVRRIVGTRKVGHAGTLDPMATGVLVVGVRRATRLLGYVSGATKQYRATIRLGAATTTDDAEGEITATVSADSLSREQIESAIAEFRGEISQVPASVSAIKVDGRRAYKRVREGEDVALAARRVVVDQFVLCELSRLGKHTVDCEVLVDCSSGTYIRALARDMGNMLGVGGHLVALRRLRVGSFAIAAAQGLEQLTRSPQPISVSLDAAVDALFPRREVSAQDARLVRNGIKLPAVGIAGIYGVFDPAGAAVSLSHEDSRGSSSVVVFPAESPA